MVNYQQSKIYKIVCNKTGKCYIGSTTKKYLSQRISNHREAYKLWKDGKGNFVSSFEIIENDDFHTILIENYSCNSKDELYSRERFYIDNNECVNKQIPTRTKKEYQESTKETKVAYDKVYREVNKEQIKSYQQERYKREKDKRNEKILCECGKYYTLQHKQRHLKTHK